MADNTKPDPEMKDDTVEGPVVEPTDESSLLRDDSEPEQSEDAGTDDEIEQPAETETPIEVEVEQAAEIEPPVSDEPEQPAETEPHIEVEVEAEQPIEIEPAIIVQPAEKRSVFVPAVLGGVVAAAFGFAMAKTDLLADYLPNSRADQLSASLDKALTDNANQIAALQSQVAGIQIPDVSGIKDQMAALSEQIPPIADSIAGLLGQVQTLDADLTKLANRLTSLEKRPISEGVSKSAINAYEAELARLQASMVQQRSEVEAMIETARSVEADSKQTQAHAADVLRVAASKELLADLRGALETGAPFAALLGSLASNSVEIQDNLSTIADDGVTTLASLQSDFPDVARAALAMARAAKTDADTGIAAFFRRQLGARSVSPRDGTDADAVLSRAEAALTDGQIATTLQELNTLPENARSEMGDWVKRATTRLAAISAVEALGRELNTK